MASPFSAAAASIDDCEEQCTQSNTCKVFSYNKNRTLCFMYSGAHLEVSEDYDSGIRK